MMRRFLLIRDEDVTGVSGTGLIAEGVTFTTGRVVVHWLGRYQSIVIWDSVASLLAVNGHGEKTYIEWVDEAVA